MSVWLKNKPVNNFQINVKSSKNGSLPKVFVEPESEPNRSESDHQRGIIESFNHATQTSNLVRSPPNGIYHGTINRGANWL